MKKETEEEEMIKELIIKKTMNLLEKNRKTREIQRQDEREYFA